MSENIAIQLTKLTHSSIVELWVLDATQLGGDRSYWCNQLNELSQPVVWQGQVYQPWPIKAEGFDSTASGPSPRPKLTVSNQFGLVGALVRDYRGLKGARVIRRRTLAKYLDAVNFQGGVNPSADPNAGYPDDAWSIDRRAPSAPRTVMFELATPMDVEGVQFPGRQVLASVCTWIYRGPDCGYTGGPCAKADDTPTDDPALDACGHRFSSCSLRLFPGNELPFSGFPGCDSIQDL